ncbi:hypothetical protein TNCV_4481071 [Trichonephila clavipes]|nr:hypothetical protein TNCV_4481071 [Trichonephila clavipes]
MGAPVFLIIKNCSISPPYGFHEALPDPILRLIELSKEDLTSDPLIITDFWVVYNLLEPIRHNVRSFEDKKQKHVFIFKLYKITLQE